MTLLFLPISLRKRQRRIGVRASMYFARRNWFRALIKLRSHLPDDFEIEAVPPNSNQHASQPSSELGIQSCNILIREGQRPSPFSPFPPQSPHRDFFTKGFVQCVNLPNNSNGWRRRRIRKKGFLSTLIAANVVVHMMPSKLNSLSSHFSAIVVFLFPLLFFTFFSVARGRRLESCTKNDADVCSG